MRQYLFTVVWTDLNTNTHGTTRVTAATAADARDEFERTVVMNKFVVVGVFAGTQIENLSTDSRETRHLGNIPLEKLRHR